MCVCRHCNGQAQCVGWTQEVGRQACGPSPLGPQGSYHRWPTDISPGLGSAKTSYGEKESARLMTFSVTKGWKDNSVRHFTFAQVRQLAGLTNLSGDTELREMLENSQENGGFIPWNHRWDHLSLLAWINHIPGNIHTGKSVIYNRDSHKSNLQSRSFPGTGLIAYIQWLLLHRHKFIRQPCLNPHLQHGLTVKVWSWTSDAFFFKLAFFIFYYFKQPCHTDHSFYSPFSFSHPYSLCSLRVCGLHY